MIESFLAVAETGNFTKAAESGKLDLIFTIRDSVKNVKFERKSQSGLRMSVLLGKTGRNEKYFPATYCVGFL